MVAVLRCDTGKLTLYVLTAKVACHDDNGVLEVYGATLVVGKTTIVQYLQEDVEDIGMSLLYLVKQYHRVWFATHSLCKLTTLIVANVSWRRTDKTTNTELLLILAHINTCHHRLVVEEIFCQSLCKLCLTYTRCAEEYE